MQPDTSGDGVSSSPAGGRAIRGPELAMLAVQSIPREGTQPPTRAASSPTVVVPWIS